MDDFYDLVYLGQASAPNAESVGQSAEPLAELGRMIVEEGLSSVTGSSMSTKQSSSHHSKCTSYFLVLI